MTATRPRSRRPTPRVPSSTATALSPPSSKIPGAALSTHVANNNRGQIAGFYSDVLPGPDGTVPPGTTHGFVRDRRGVTTFDVPDASFILVKGINNRGEVVGEYGGPDAVPGPDGTVPPGTIHGFVRDRRGVITTFDVPFFRLHDVADINDRGRIVGYYDKPDGTSGGYLRNKGGRFIPIDFPGASYTTIHGINNRGQIVGRLPRGRRYAKPRRHGAAGRGPRLPLGKGALHHTRRPRIDLDATLRHQRSWRHLGRVL